MTLPLLRKRSSSRWLILVAIAFLAIGEPLQAGDWPQILGPHRNGVAPDETLLDKWPEDGPQRLWQVKLGEGYGGVVVVGDRVVAFHRVGFGAGLCAGCNCG